MNKVLFVSTNDGSDTRINKEIRSLSKWSEVFFIGVGSGDNCYVSNYCTKVFLVNGKRNTVPTLLKQIGIFLRILFLKRIKSVHIINEQLYIFFYPFLFFKHTVLDLFDSIFLKKNFGGERLRWLKWLLYLPANRILVTDKNRFNLMPLFVRKKCLVLPNYPNRFISDIKKEEDARLRILYNGWMGIHRGSYIIDGLLTLGLPVKVYMAGWFSDDFTKSLIEKHTDKIKWLGVVKQKEILELSKREIDYIMCTYAPINDNNINASPNKIYDAIQTRTPIIMNGEVTISKWVEENEIGFVLPKYEVEDFFELFNQLNNNKNKYSFNASLQETYTWENFEKRLLSAHRLEN